MTTFHHAVLVARQPISLGIQSSGGTSLVRTHRHIPGTVLRGALARAWIAEHGTPDRAEPRLMSQFNELFDGHVRYEGLVPEGWQLVPLSVQRCKYRRLPQCSSWYADQALGDPAGSCGVCDGPGELSKGGIEPLGGRGLLRQSTHVELTPQGTSVEGQLFSRESLRPTVFQGRLTLPEALSDESRNWLLAPQRAVTVGGRRSTSGLAEFTATPAEPPAAHPVCRRLALRFTAPALLVDPAGLPRLRPGEDELARRLGSRVTIVGSWVRHEQVGGWNAAAELPKPVELAVSAGSTFLLELADDPDPAGLVALIANGLGLRRNEGFGALSLDSGPWSPPSAPTPAIPSSVTASDQAERAARLLTDTGHGPWFLDRLRELLASGAPPSDGIALLDRPEVRRLLPGRRDAVERLLLTSNRQRLDDVLRHLELLVRRGEF